MKRRNPKPIITTMRLTNKYHENGGEWYLDYDDKKMMAFIKKDLAAAQKEEPVRDWHLETRGTHVGWHRIQDPEKLFGKNPMNLSSPERKTLVKFLEDRGIQTYFMHTIADLRDLKARHLKGDRMRRKLPRKVRNNSGQWTTASQNEYVTLKKALKAAIASKDPDRIIREANHGLARFEIIGEPDDWSMWERAKEDAQLQQRMSAKGKWNWNPATGRKVAIAWSRARTTKGRKALHEILRKRAGFKKKDLRLGMFASAQAYKKNPKMWSARRVASRLGRPGHKRFAALMRKLRKSRKNRGRR